MAQLKTFEQFISNENTVNEERLANMLEDISEETKRVLVDKLIPIVKEFGKFLTGESYDKNIKKGLIIRSHKSDIIKGILKVVKHEYLFDSYWIKGKKLNSKDIYNALRDGNNQCIVFDDCEPSYLNNTGCVTLFKHAFSNDDDEYCARIRPWDPHDIDVENKRYNLCFRGIIIIICSETKDEIDKVLLDKFEFIDLTK